MTGWLHLALRCVLALVALAAASRACLAADIPWYEPESGKLLATAGISEIEGTGGGGLVPWALVTGYETRDAVGANIHDTFVRLRNFTLGSAGVAVGLWDRAELSYAREIFDTGDSGARLGIGRGLTLHEDVLGAKLRLFGDAVYDQDRWLPQVAVGVQFKSTDHAALLRAIGARVRSGVDFYLAATKLLLRESLLVGMTLRETRANQFGLLGFGGDRQRGYSTQAEASVARLLSRHLTIGAEYRSKPDNLRFAHENDAYDAFAAWFPDKNFSLTLAYVALGSIARQPGQNGVHLSIQLGF